jgi:hypothetical protein
VRCEHYRAYGFASISASPNEQRSAAHTRRGADRLIPFLGPEPNPMTEDPAHDRITTILAAITGLVTGPPNLIGFDVTDLRAALMTEAAPCLDRARRRDQTAPSAPPIQPLTTSGGSFGADERDAVMRFEQSNCVQTA